MREGNYSPYKGKPEPIFLEGRKVPGFEIFMDYLGEKGMDEPTLEELIMDENITAEGMEVAIGDVGQNEDATVNLETFVQNSFIGTFCDDFVISLSSLFELDDLFFSKVDAMKYEFNYLCDVLPNGYVHCDDHFMHIFDINSMQNTTFNLGTIENPINIIITSDLSPDESEKLKELLIKR